MKKLAGVCIVVAAVVVGVLTVRGSGVPSSHWRPAAGGAALEQTAPHPEKAETQEAGLNGRGEGMAAIGRAARANKYLFIYFWKEEDEHTRAMQQVFEAATKKVADRADWVMVKTTDASEKQILTKFEIERAPMPLVLVLAPNGAITGGFPTKFDEAALTKAFATPCTEKCMKALQQGKLVLLCVQNASTKLNDAAVQGVRDFQADPRFGHAAEILFLDPADQAEAEFLADLQIDPQTAQAVTAFLAPPGAAIGKFEGATSKDELIAALQKAGSSSCPGGACGPGGCGPKKGA